MDARGAHAAAPRARPPRHAPPPARAAPARPWPKRTAHRPRAFRQRRAPLDTREPLLRGTAAHSHANHRTSLSLRLRRAISRRAALTLAPHAGQTASPEGAAAREAPRTRPTASHLFVHVCSPGVPRSSHPPTHACRPSCACLAGCSSSSHMSAGTKTLSRM